MIKIILTLLCIITFMSLELQAQNDSSYVISNIKSDKGFVVIDDNFKNCIEIEKRDTLTVPANIKSMTFIQKDFKDITVNQALTAGDTTQNSVVSAFLSTNTDRKKYSSYARCFWDANIIVLTDYDSKIKINDQGFGSENIRLSLTKGSYILNIENGNTTLKKEFTVSDDLQIINSYLRPSKSQVFKRSFIPGYAQITKRENFKGFIFIGISSALTISTALSVINSEKEKNKYEDLRNEYRLSQDPNRILEIISESNQALDEIEKSDKIRNYSLLGLGLVYTLNIFDGIKPPKIGFRSDRLYVKPFVDFDKDLIPKANLKIDF